MEVLKFDLNKKAGDFQIMNATNGGPWHKRHATDQYRSNFKDYKAVGFPYSRNHDSGVNGIYGGPYSHDISKIFRNFDADENDPASYDFACTDESILCCLEAGTETFFRLGETIEHQIKKHATLPPADFHKWARICEHIIRHYNEGWADGFNLNMQYWEIWNEPDLDDDDSTNKRTWGGTKLQFFDMYEITAKHLKKCFPHLKIGGPAHAWNLEWSAEFLAEMKKRGVEIDFYSWHGYWTSPEKMLEKAATVKKHLLDNGYEKAESILNEWNYVRGWTEDFQYSINTIHGIKGAAFMLAMIISGQKSPCVDMMMYYDTRPGVFCGVFDLYDYHKLKGYYPLYWYSKFYGLTEVRCEEDPDNIYSLCGVDENGKILCAISNYYETDERERNIALDFARGGKFEVYLLDETHDAQLVDTTEKLEFTMKPNTCLFIKEV